MCVAGIASGRSVANETETRLSPLLLHGLEIGGEFFRDLLFLGRHPLLDLFIRGRHALLQFALLRRRFFVERVGGICEKSLALRGRAFLALIVPTRSRTLQPCSLSRASSSGLASASSRALCSRDRLPALPRVDRQIVGIAERLEERAQNR